MNSLPYTRSTFQKKKKNKSTGRYIWRNFLDAAQRQIFFFNVKNKVRHIKGRMKPNIHEFRIPVGDRETVMEFSDVLTDEKYQLAL